MYAAFTHRPWELSQCGVLIKLSGENFPLKYAQDVESSFEMGRISFLPWGEVSNICREHEQQYSSDCLYTLIKCYMCELLQGLDS